MSKPVCAEEWRAVPGLSGIAASSRGRIIGPSGRILKPRPIYNGYLKVIIYTPTRSSRFIHHLVSAAFIGPRPLGMEVDHLDGNKANNAPPNLEYVTRAENCRRACALGLQSAPFVKGESHPNARLTEDNVRRIRIMRASGTGPQELARVFGITPKYIGEIVRGKAWPHIKPCPCRRYRPRRKKGKK